MISKRKSKFVYIYGLGYSGSTILNILLGTHPKIIGIGEFYTSFKEKKLDFTGRICSCGEPLDQCNFWSKYQYIYEEYTQGRISCWKGYKKFLEEFYNNNPDKILVDSSKRRDFFKEIANNLNEDRLIDLRTLYLLRDVRGFSVSLRKRRDNRDRWGNIFLYQLGWWYKQKKFKNEVEDSYSDYLQLGYEELILKNEKSLKAICNFLDVSFLDKMLEGPSASSSHTCSGNPIRTKSRKNKLVYDCKWFEDYWVNLSYSLLPFVARWNKKNVYNNINGA